MTPLSTEGRTKEVVAVNLGLTDYKTTWDLQRRIADARTKELIPDVLLLNEHRPVYTFGKSSDEDHLLARESDLKRDGVDVYRVDRGGGVTFHGPGQLVGYPVLGLGDSRPDIHRYLRDLEEVIIRTLAAFGVESRRDESFTGVWTGGDKIAAIGIRVVRWVTMHGFALNVNTDLSHFERIIPCGIFHKGVSSLERLLGHPVPLEDVAEETAEQFGCVFGRRVTTVGKEEFFYLMDHLPLARTECLQPENQ